jgi:hypothetical protein
LSLSNSDGSKQYVVSRGRKISIKIKGTEIKST